MWRGVSSPGAVILTAFVCAMAPGVCRAQDAVAAVLRKSAITAVDKGTLETELPPRVKHVFGNPTNLSAGDARNKLVTPTKEKDVTPAGLDAYSEVLCGELEKYVGQQDLNQALTATLVLKELESPKTIDTLLAALKSPHPGVRFIAVQGLQALRSKIKADDTAAPNVIAALGKAGADEKDEQVLRRIYETLNFKPASGDFKFNDQVAAALSEIFASRLRALTGGSHDEYRDEDSYAAAANCYAAATPPHQAALIAAMYEFLRFSLDHYFDPGVAPESLPVVIRRIQRAEKALDEMMNASKVTPQRSIADRLKPADRQKQEKDIRAALEELHTLLKGDPWKLP